MESAGMSCLQFRPRQVICVRRKSERSEIPVNKSTGLTVAADSIPLSGTDFTLDRYLTAPAGELRLLEMLSRRSDVVAASLNYLGTSASVPQSSIAHEPPIEIGLIKYVPPNNSTILTVDELPKQLGFVVVAVDPSPRHCDEVIRSILDGITRQTVGMVTPSVLGFCIDTGDRGSFQDLFTFSKLLIQTLRLDGTVLAINMSVDFGIVCLGTDSIGGTNPLPPEIATAAYSFPFFESVLSIVRDALKKNSQAGESGGIVPAFFAASGNRDHDIRWRLGYPAVRPETVAVTFVTRNSRKVRYEPHPCADVPASYGTKPCLAIDVQGISRSVPLTGTSFACAWLAGAYAALAIQESDGKYSLSRSPTLSKTARLLDCTENQFLKSSLPGWVTPSVALFEGSPRPGEFSHLRELIRVLNDHFPNCEFLLTGSMAMVNEWMRILSVNIEELSSAFADLGDIDLLYSGALTNEDISRCRRIVRDWMAEKIGRRWQMHAPLNVEVHPMEGTTSALGLTQCVIPVAQFFLTANGSLDAWNGKYDLEEKCIRIAIPRHIESWALNPQFETGSAGAALGILIWINSILLLMLLTSKTIPHEDPPEAEQDSLELVRQLLGLPGQLPANGVSLNLLFGFHPDDDQERILRRLDRARHLVGSFQDAGPEVRKLRDLADRIEALYNDARLLAR